MQPTALPDGHLVAVARADDHADLFLLDANGNVVSQITHNQSPPRRDGSLEDNHWSFHPRLSADGSALFMDFDSPKNGFLVDFAIWAIPWPQPAPSPSASPAPHLINTSPPLPKSKRWSTPNDYTGGDVEATPLPGGQVVFVRYLIDTTFHVHSEIVLASSALGDPAILTPPADDCSQPSLAPDGQHLAMVCTHGLQSANVEVARLNIPVVGSTTPTLVERTTLVNGSLASFPTWSPDGSGLVYLAPALAGGNFQLWWLRGAGTATPAAPVQVTTSVGLDATSAPAWVG
jgi:WD40 repeat protein